MHDVKKTQGQRMSGSNRNENYSPEIVDLWKFSTTIIKNAKKKSIVNRM